MVQLSHPYMTAAAAKSLQLCPTLCDPIDGSPPGSPIPGILQARTLLLIAKFRLKLKIVGKTTIPFRYDPNQIPYDYMLEVTKRFEGLDMIDRVPEELWMEVRDIVQEAVIKTIPKKKKCKKAKWLFEEDLQIAEKRREAKGKGENERYIHLKAGFQRTERRDKKAFLSDQCKEIEENNRMGKTGDLFKKIRDTK